MVPFNTELMKKEFNMERSLKSFNLYEESWIDFYYLFFRISSVAKKVVDYQNNRTLILEKIFSRIS